MAKKTLMDAYRFPGFRPIQIVKGRFGDSKAFVITLKRRSKKRFAGDAGESGKASTISALNSSGIFPVVDAAYISKSKFAVWIAGGAGG